MEDILDENLSKELEIVRLKKRWKAKEAALRAERDQQFGMDEREESNDQEVTLKRQPKQVFVYFHDHAYTLCYVHNFLAVPNVNFFFFFFKVFR